jgi:hypothetical protein
MCDSEDDAGDKRENAGKEHNIDDELDHYTPPRFTLEISSPCHSFMVAT